MRADPQISINEIGANDGSRADKRRLDDPLFEGNAAKIPQPSTVLVSGREHLGNVGVS